MVRPARQVLWLFVLPGLLVLTTAAPAQVVAGEVRGFDDQPTAGVVVRAFGRQQERLGEVLSDEQGRFELVTEIGIAAIEVQNEGVVVQRAIADGGEYGVRVTFAGATYFTLRGHVVAPDGEPVAVADLVCRDAEARTIAVVTTDARGAFMVRSGAVITDLMLDPLGWRHVEPGPFDADRGIAVDLRLVRDDYFALRGRVLDDAGAPTAAARVAAFAKGERIGGAISGPDGTFVLWLNRAADELRARQAIPLVHLKGRWQAAGEVDLDARVHGLVLVTGRFVDKDGFAVASGMVFGVDRRAAPGRQSKPLGMTDSQGSFRVLVPRGTPFLFGFRDGGDHSAFAAVPAAGEQVELRSNR